MSSARLPHPHASMYSVEEIAFPQRALFRDLTFPLFRPLLITPQLDNRYFTLGVELGGEPVGLAVAEIDQQDPAQADIHSIAVAAQHRRRGIGVALMNRLEEVLLERGVGLGRFTYMSGLPQTPSVEAMLRKCGWSEARPRMMVCRGDMPSILKAPWMQERSFPPEFSVFSWCALSAEERAGILAKQSASPWYPEELTPFKNEQQIEPINSLGLRYNGEIVGWCIGHVMTADTVRYSSLFVRREHQITGRAIPLLANSIYRLLDAPHYKLAMFDVAMDNVPMLRFVKTRMAPYLISVRYILRSHRLIGAWAEAAKKLA